MSKIRLVLMVCAILFSLNAYAQSQEITDNDIANLTAKIIEENPQIKNPDLVFPGDKVRVTEDGEMITYTVGKWSRNSSDGCLWQIAKKRLQEKYQIAENENQPLPGEYLSPSPATQESLTILRLELAAANQKLKVATHKESIAWRMFIASCIASLIFGMILLQNFLIKRRWKAIVNGCDNAVINEGLPRELSSAMLLIDKNYPRLRREDEVDGVSIQKASRGHLKRISGPKTIQVMAAFSDGFHLSKLHDGEEIHQAVYSDGRTYYFKSSCGNMLVSLGDGQFQFPADWRYVWEASVELVKEETPTGYILTSERMSNSQT